MTGHKTSSLCCLLLITILLAGMKARVPVDEKKILGFISQLESRAMEGRKSGESSGRNAELLIAHLFNQVGLKPGGNSGTYFQEFTFPMMRFESVGILRRLRNAHLEEMEYSFGDDYFFAPVSSPGHVRAEVVFIGYGLSRPDLGWDDYDGIDTSGKILLSLSGLPPGDPSKWGRDGSDYIKADQASKHNALGLLIFDPDVKESKLPRYRVWSFHPSTLKRGLILARVGRRVVDGLLGSTQANIELIKSEIDGSQRPKPFMTGNQIELKAEIMMDSEREAANVIGRIEGCDPSLKDEVVIISGHYDGGGKDPDGVIYNGANDNASGVGVMLEIARAMIESRIRSRRTILFIAWGAEEQGGYGSKYFLDHPPLALEKIVSAFILDCVGHGEGKFWLFGAEHFSEAFKRLREHVDADLISEFRPRAEGGSDQYFFQEKGVISFFVHNVQETALGHTPQDDLAHLNVVSLGRAARFVYAAASFTAEVAAGAE